MITFLLKVLILSYLIYMIKSVYDMIQYNKNASLLTIDNPNKDNLEPKLLTKCPLLLQQIQQIQQIQHNQPIHLTIEQMDKQIPGYILNEKGTMISLHQLQLSDKISITKQKQMVTDYHLNERLSSIFDLVTTVFSCCKEYSLSIYRGEYRSELMKNYRERLLISSLLGSFTVYIFNPKHEKDIKGLDTQLIKKWGIKLSIHKGQALYIPTEWYYFYETSNEDSLLAHMECDSYSTVIYNYLRKK